MKGIDVSLHNGKIDWQKVKADGVEFVIIRAGYGKTATQRDQRFEENYAGAKEAGLPVGAYWYSYATTPAEAKAEAVACIEVLKGKQFEFPIWFDQEEKRQFATGKANCSAMARAFCDALEAAGYWVGLYTSRSALASYIEDSIKTRYAMWIAEWSSKLNYSGAVGIWQNSSKGRVNGITGDVDTDIAYIDYPAKIIAAGKNGYSKDGFPIPARVLRENYVGLDVKWMQQKLKDAGHYSGQISGIFDAETLKALLLFQYRECLTIDGVCGQETRKALIG